MITTSAPPFERRCLRTDRVVLAQVVMFHVSEGVYKTTPNGSHCVDSGNTSLTMHTHTHTSRKSSNLVFPVPGPDGKFGFAAKLMALGRLGGNDYGRVTEMFELGRPQKRDV